MSNHMVTTELIDTKKNWATSYNCMHIIQLSYLINLFSFGMVCFEEPICLSSVLLSTWKMNWLNFELSSPGRGGRGRGRGSYQT